MFETEWQSCLGEAKQAGVWEQGQGREGMHTIFQGSWAYAPLHWEAYLICGKPQKKRCRNPTHPHAQTNHQTYPSTLPENTTAKMGGLGMYLNR